jgi:hypothetical protein
MIRIKWSIVAAFAGVTVLGHASFMSAAAEKWEFRKQTGSNNCVVQLSTSLPKLGNLISEHETRKAACEAARDRYDKASEDTSKCWVYGPGTITGCAAEGIKLPPD